MAFNINEFRSSFSDGEPASPTNYEVSIVQRPRIGALEEQKNVSAENILIFRCNACTLPGKQMLTSDRLTYGPIRKIITSALYTDVRFSFIVSDNKQELRYFTRWHNSIINNELNDGIQTHDVEYYDSYTGSVIITHFDKQNNIKYKISLLEAYPISVEEIPLSWDNNNEFIRVDVTMAYKIWKHIK